MVTIARKHKLTGGGNNEIQNYLAQEVASSEYQQVWYSGATSFWFENGGIQMNYWVAMKFKDHKPLYIAGTDDAGGIIHTEDKSKAFKFYNFNTAMKFVHLGYGLEKH